MASSGEAFFSRLRVPREFMDAAAGPDALQASAALHVPRSPVVSGSRDRDELFHLLPEPHGGGAPLLPHAPVASLDLVRRANHTISVLRALNGSRLDERCRGPRSHHDRRRFQRQGEACQRASLGILERWLYRPPPVDRPRGEAALAQLLGSRTRSSTYTSSSAETRSGPLRKGDLCRAVPWAISLPAPGHQPIDLRDMSPRCAAVLNDMEGLMLRPEAERDVLREQAGIRPFTDPGLRGKRDRLWLALRMWLAGMVATTARARGFVDIFTVVKKLHDDAGPHASSVPPARAGRKVKAHAGPVLERSGDPAVLQQRLQDIGLVERPVRAGEQYVTLRAVYDERFNNLAWRRPPWCGLASVEAISQLDFSNHASRGFVAEAACGDVADWYYRLRTPPEMQQFFCLQGITVSELYDLAVTCGFRPDFERDDSMFLCTTVLVMGFSWAVYFAQTALEDVLESVGGAFARERRLVHSVQVQGVSDDLPMGAWGYIDDFGVLGMRAPDGGHPVFATADEAAGALRDMGFTVHKEQRGERIEALGMFMGAPPDSEHHVSKIVVRGADKKVWLCYEALIALAERSVADVSEVECAVSLATWLVLPARPALAIFSAVYAFIQEHRGRGPVDLWGSARNELGAMAGVLILAEAHLDRPWDDSVYMVDASPTGGAVLVTTAAVDEVCAEARMGQYGGWLRWLDHVVSDAGPQDGFEDEFSSLAEAASRAPELPRIAPRLPLFCLFILFSGVRRPGDLQEAWEAVAHERGAIGIVVAVDIRHGREFDLRDPDRRRALLLRVAAEADALQAAPPCSTWSVARSRPGGPPPLRSRSSPWGLSGLSRKSQKHVDEHSDLLRFSWDSAEALGRAGGFNLIEHPADPGPPHPSSWDACYVQASEASCGNHRYYLDQCTFGAASQKPTTLSTNVPAAHVARLGLSGRCPGQSDDHRHVDLVGRNADGSFRTQQAQEYPPAMCWAIAEALFAAAWDRRLAGGGAARDYAVTFEDEARARANWRRRQEEADTKRIAPPVGPNWDEKGRWRVVVTVDWQHDEHNNVTEARTALLAIRRQARRMGAWGHRVLVIGDSQVTIGVLAKGRSSSWGLLRQCRKLAALHLGLGITLVMRYIPTDRNLADGPSRGWRIGVAPKTPEIVRLPDAALAAPGGPSADDVAALSGGAPAYGAHWGGFG